MIRHALILTFLLALAGCGPSWESPVSNTRGEIVYYVTGTARSAIVTVGAPDGGQRTFPNARLNWVSRTYVYVMPPDTIWCRAESSDGTPVVIEITRDGFPWRTSKPGAIAEVGGRR